MVLSNVVASVVVVVPLFTFWSCGTDGSAFCCCTTHRGTSVIVVLSVVVDSVVLSVVGISVVVLFGVVVSVVVVSLLLYFLLLWSLLLYFLKLSYQWYLLLLCFLELW